jgi:hypothetical protein
MHDEFFDLSYPLLVQRLAQALARAHDDVAQERFTELDDQARLARHRARPRRRASLARVYLSRVASRRRARARRSRGVALSRRGVAGGI